MPRAGRRLRLGAMAASCLAAALACEAGWQLKPAFELRERAEYFENAGWDSENGSDPFLLHRLLLSADLESGESFRFYAQLLSAAENGRNEGPRPTDQDRLDLHQAYADWRPRAGLDLTLRLGRQELAFGSQRLVSTRLGPNVPRSFDGVRLLARAGAWSFDAFATRPVGTREGVFDDATERGRRFGGFYAVGPFPWLAAASIDLYYLLLERDRASFDQGTAAERRSSAGARLWRRAAPWDYNFELVYQWGRFGRAPIEAFTAASDSGYTFAAARWQPRLGLKADITSGDRDPGDPALQSFHPLFPRGGYFAENQLVGPVNHLDLHPSLALHPSATTTLTVAWDFFWRQSRRDGLYDVPGNPLRPAAGTRERYVGSQPSLALAWEPAPGFTFALGLEYFLAGPFLRETGPADDVIFATTSLTFRY